MLRAEFRMTQALRRAIERCDSCRRRLHARVNRQQSCSDTGAYTTTTTYLNALGVWPLPSPSTLDHAA